ncbi:MAG: hypothetical protein JWO00_525 [Candidatus Parcubacteria bacterium]|nr:hypothetical protein [Candidatus Parcubacteria bacterium]
MDLHYKRAGVIICFGILEAFLAMGFYAVPVHAETRISGIITGDAVWTKAASPYLLTDTVTVADDVHLTIEPGAHVGIAPEADTGDVSEAPGIFVPGGRIYMKGTHADHIFVQGISGIFVASGPVNNGSADISETDFSGGTYVSFDNSRGTIATTTIAGASLGVYTKDSIVSIAGSRIRNNDIGIYIQPHKVFLSVGPSPFRSNASNSYGMGGIGNALDAAPDLSASSSLVIMDSAITDNTTQAIFNNSDLTVRADGNWWGSPSGPALQGANSVRGAVTYEPWLISEPAFDSDPSIPAVCCSSVLFIPGLEASRLSRVESAAFGGLFGRGTTTNQLWEPNRNADVTKLFLNPSGSSNDVSVYSESPIDSVFGIFDIYGSFMKFLDGMVGRGNMNEWRAFGYDWRKPIDQVVLGTEKKATTTESLVRTVEGLAARSKTGKVSIVAHSNGGLVAKYLVKVLADIGKAGLIDSVISIGVPYLGTPEAIAGLLHGDDQAILGGLILNQEHARGLGANMPSAYSLLPSRRFFSAAFGPTIAFASTSIPGINNGTYPQTASSFEEQQAFIADAVNARKSPASSNTKFPLKGNQLLMAAADVLHSILDPFEWPATITRWAIVGWGSTTTKNILYSDKGHALVRNIYGDGTVKAQSAAYQGGHIISVDLAEASRLEKKGIAHANILAASSTKGIIGSILSIPVGSTANSLKAISSIPAVEVGNKDWNALDAAYDASVRQLRVSTHSPVKLHVYDGAGNHTGEIPLPPQIAAQAEEGLYSMKEEKIPGSTYDILGCESDIDCDTSVTVPENGRAYTIVVDGAGTGTFTLDIERVRGATTTETVEWKNVPVTELTVATTTIQSSQNPSGIPPHLASSTSPLLLDINGDGGMDATSSPNRSFDPRTFADFFKKLKWPNIYHGISHGISKHFGHLHFRDVSVEDRDRILAEIAAFLKRFGK